MTQLLLSLCHPRYTAVQSSLSSRRMYQPPSRDSHSPKPYVPLEEAQTTAKEPEMIAQPTASAQHLAQLWLQICSLCVLKAGFPSIQDIPASMAKFLPTTIDSAADHEHLMSSLVRIQAIASTTHQKAKQVRQQQIEAQVSSVSSLVPMIQPNLHGLQGLPSLSS